MLMQTLLGKTYVIIKLTSAWHLTCSAAISCFSHTWLGLIVLLLTFKNAGFLFPLTLQLDALNDYCEANIWCDCSITCYAESDRSLCISCHHQWRYQLLVSKVFQLCSSVIHHVSDRTDVLLFFINPAVYSGCVMAHVNCDALKCDLRHIFTLWIYFLHLSSCVDTLS